jgi:hypothetical protein
MKAELLIGEDFEAYIEKCKIIPIQPSRDKEKNRYARQGKFNESRIAVPIIEEETDLCVALWGGVVMQAIYDISGAANDYERKLIKTEAYSWFSSEDFRYVCELAQINPNKILDLVRLVRCGRLEIRDSKTIKIKGNNNNNRRL